MFGVVFSPSPMHDGKKYFLTIVDDHKKATWVYLLPFRPPQLASFVTSPKSTSPDHHNHNPYPQRTDETYNNEQRRRKKKKTHVGNTGAGSTDEAVLLGQTWRRREGDRRHDEISLDWKPLGRWRFTSSRIASQRWWREAV